VDLAARRGGQDQRPCGGEATGSNPTDCGTCGTKRRVLTVGHGMPCAVVVAGAKRPDMTRRAATLDAVVVERPEPTEATPPPGCLDKGDDDDACRQVAEPQEDIPPMRSRGEEQREQRELPGYRPRRWVVAVGHSWVNRFRKLQVHLEKKLETPLALLQFACAHMVLKRAEVFR
jgi:putative transposase